MKLLNLNKLLKLKQPWQSSECSSLLVCIISTTAIYICIYMYVCVYAHTHRVRKRQEPQHMCCINKKFQLEFLTLPSEVKVSCCPAKTPHYPVISSKTHREHPHMSRFSIKTPQPKNFMSWQKHHSFPICKCSPW